MGGRNRFNQLVKGKQASFCVAFVEMEQLSDSLERCGVKDTLLRVLID